MEEIRALPWPKLIGIGLVILCCWSLAVLHIGSLLYLLKIGQPANLASPLLLYQYWTIYGHVPGVQFWVLACAGVAAVGLTIPLVIVAVPAGRKLHGDAKLAKSRDLSKLGMLMENGQRFLLMTFGGKYVWSPKDKIISIILAAPPRSGKGVSQVQPNMLFLNCSVIVTDIRQESYGLTSGFRSTISEVYLINPYPSKAKDAKGKVLIGPDGQEQWELRTHRYNPFYYVPEEYGLRVNQIMKIGGFLFPDPTDGKDAFWSSSARSLFVGLSLYVFESKDSAGNDLPRTLGEILRQAQSCGDSGDSISEYWAGIVQERKAAGSPLSPVCEQCIMDFCATGGNTITSIRKSLTTGLESWQNPTVDAMTSGNDFDLRDLRKKKMTIYLGVSPDNLARAKILLSLFLQQAMDLNMQEMPADNPAIKHPLALILDEITALGRMEVLAKAIGYLNGYWIMPYLIIQSFSQLRSVYGKEDAATMIECCQMKMAFPPKSQEDAELLSKEIGFITEKNRSISENRGFSSASGGSTGSTSTSVAQRALLLPQELKTLHAQSIIMLMEGMPPVIGRKILWYVHPIFKERGSKLPVPAPICCYQVSAVEAQAGALQGDALAAAVGAAGMPPAPAQDDEDDFFSLKQREYEAAQATQTTPEETETPADEETASGNAFSANPAMGGVFAEGSDADADEAEEEEEKEDDAADDSSGGVSIPETFTDYDLPMEVIWALILEDNNVPVTPNTLAICKQASIDDFDADFSDVVIPAGGADLSGADMGAMVANFMAKIGQNQTM